jgi:peptide/nickel transport system permease protein
MASVLIRRNLKYFVNRLGYTLMALLGLSILIFIISRILPGDPARMALGPRAPEWTVQKLREELSLDQPLYTQYYRWLTGALRGDFGISLFTRRPVLSDIREFLPATAELVLVAGAFQILFGISMGVAAGRYRDTWIDNVTRFFAYFGVASPPFVFAILLLLLFGFVLDVLPTAGRLSPGTTRPPFVTGMISVDSLLAGNFAALGDTFKHMIMPGISMALGQMAQIARITRVSVGEKLQKEYIFAAREHGIPEWRVVFKYLLKPSLIPTVSILGLQLGALFANAFLVELVFNWPGFSRYGINAMLRKDLNAISAVVLVMGTIYICLNLLVDLAVGIIDPRVRLMEERRE